MLCPEEGAASMGGSCVCGLRVATSILAAKCGRQIVSGCRKQRPAPLKR